MIARLGPALAVSLAALLCCGCAELLSELGVAEPADAATPEDGLREALRVGTRRAVDLLGQENGYLGNLDVRIPIPEDVESLARGLRKIGAGEIVDDFLGSMNRAAEAAAPLAAGVFVDTINGMTFADAVTILRGTAHEATDYLRENAGPRLRELFHPIVAEQLDSVGATRAFGRLESRIRALPLVEMPALDLRDYVTDRALDGLFRTIAREEERIREDPLARTTALLKRFFGEGRER